MYNRHIEELAKDAERALNYLSRNEALGYKHAMFHMKDYLLRTVPGFDPDEFTNACGLKTKSCKCQPRT